MSTKVHLIKAIVFPVVMYGCESWTTKKAESQRIDAFELWCWRRLLRVPWTARRSNQSILKEISPGCLLEGLMLKLKLHTLAAWCKELTHLKRPWCWERLRAGREGDDRGWDGWMASPTQWTWVWVNSGSWWWTGRPGVLRFMGLQSQTRLSNWTELIPSTWVSRFFPVFLQFPLHVLLLRIMPSTITSTKIYLKYFSPVGLIYRVTVLSFPKHNLSHQHTLWTSQMWHHSPSCCPSSCHLTLQQPSESSSTTLHFPSPSISGLLLLFLQSSLHLHSYHLWLGLGPPDLLGKASILVFLPPRISWLPSHLYPAAIG